MIYNVIPHMRDLSDFFYLLFTTIISPTSTGSVTAYGVLPVTSLPLTSLPAYQLTFDQLPTYQFTFYLLLLNQMQII